MSSEINNTNFHMDTLSGSHGDFSNSLSGGGLSGMERVSRREAGEMGGACLRPWARVKPRDNAVEINGRGSRDVLHV